MRRLSRGQVFDVAVFALGATATLRFALPWFRHPTDVRLAYLLVALSVALLAQFPLELATRAGEVVIGFEAAALVFLALVAPTSEALALWLLAMFLAHGRLPRKRWNDRLFNIGCTSVSGLVATLCVAAGRGHDTAVVLGFVSLGCAAYFVLDLLLTAVSLSVLEGVAVADALPLRNALLPLAVFIGIDTLGYMAALLYRAYASWALLLLVVPLATILVAARAVTRARVSEQRTEGLFAIAQAAAQAETPERIVTLLVERLTELLPNRAVVVRATPPGPEEIGGTLGGSGHEDSYVVVSRGPGAPEFRDDERETVQTLASVAADALDRQRLVAEMTWMARFDPLTGLANRAMFVDRLEHGLHRTRRGRGVIAVLYCDLDGFKRVNDRFGHQTGDGVLLEVADRLRATIRVADTAARFGGDEFAVIAEDLVDAAEAVRLGDRIVAALEQPFHVRGQQMQLGVSIGIAATDGSAEPEALLRDADMAMYRAKAFGKSRVEFFDPQMRQESERRILLEDALRRALAEDTLTLAVQPVVDLRTGAVDGFEALLRWTHPTLGAVSPDQLLPVAEQAGLMPLLGRWVLREAHRLGVELGTSAGRQLTMAVNVAAEQLRDGEFLAEAEQLAADKRVHLVLELTERALVEESTASAALRRLSDAGAGIAIDDFGVGYSSISYLHRFDCIDIVKIDRSFVRTLSRDDRTAALVESIVAMADAFGTAVVAEGVEDIATCEALSRAGCSLAQGFLFSPAVALAAARDLVSAPEPAFTGVTQSRS